MALVYLATNTVNGKQYVGFTARGMTLRRQEHENQAAAGGRMCRVFHAALRKHGPDVFLWEVLFEGLPDDALTAERYFIWKLGSMRHGYNLTSGGDDPFVNEETRRKLSAARKGVPKSPEHRAKLAANCRAQAVKQKGVPLTAKHKERIKTGSRPRTREHMVAMSRAAHASPSARAAMDAATRAANERRRVEGRFDLPKKSLL